MYKFTRNFIHRTYGEINSVEVEANVTSFKVNGLDLPRVSVAYLLNFAFQSLQDAYAGAKNLAEAQALWEKRFERLLDGEIGVRSGNGLSERDRMRYSVAREILRSAMAAEGKPYKGFTGLDAARQTEILDKVIASASDAIDKEVDKRLAAKAKAVEVVSLEGLGL